MAEYSANAVQTVNPGETIVFTNAPVPCEKGYVRWREGSGVFLLSGANARRSCRCNPASATYLARFGCNVAVPTGETVGAITVAIALDGNTIADTTMEVTPAAVEEFWNIGRVTNVPVWANCCQSMSIRNTSDIPILVSNANVVFSRPDLNMTY